MKLNVLVVGALSLLLASPLLAQNRTVVQGRIVDANGQPVAGAEVVLEYLGGAPRTITTRSNEKGKYIQVGLRPGPYRITFQKEGYAGGAIERRLSGRAELPEYRLVPASQAPKVDATRVKAREAFQRGIDLTRAGSYDEALRAFDELIELSPDIAIGHYNRGFVLIQKQEWERAEASLEKAMALDPDYSDARLALAKLYQDTGRGDEALALMNATASDAGGDARIHFNRGVFNLNAGNSTEALAAFQKAEELDPSNPEVHFHLGTLAVGQGNLAEGIERLERYLSMSPDNAQNKTTAQGLLQALKK